MNPHNFHKSNIQIDEINFSIIHDAPDRIILKHFSRWYQTTFDYGYSSFISFLDRFSGFRYFTLKQFLKYKK